jgi:hypothetical protein
VHAVSSTRKGSLEFLFPSLELQQGSCVLTAPRPG